MQVSGTSASAMGALPMLAQQHQAAEGADVPAQDQTLTPRATPQAGQAEVAGKAERKDQPDQTDKAASNNKEKPENSEPEQDPLTDPSSEEYAQVKELQARDTEVRAHEQAHLAVAGKYATSGPTYSFQSGPDGKQYAIGGEVGIDVSEVPGDPSATIAKMQVVQRAAMAPAEPSGQDIRVAAQAAQTASAARAELASQQFKEMQGGGDAPEPGIDAKPGEEKKPTATEKEAQQSYQSTQRAELQPNLFEARA